MKPRRRHSAVFVSGALVMFGGFDGSFYNDLNVLDFMSVKKQVIQIQQSSITQDYKKLVGCYETADTLFQLDNQEKSKVYAHKALVLFRLVQREYQCENAEEQKISHIANSPNTSDFIRKVYESKHGKDHPIFLKDVRCKASFLKLLEYLYCDKFLEPLTVTQLKGLAEVCRALKLTHLTKLFKSKAEIARIKLNNSLITEYQQQKQAQGQAIQQIPKQQQQVIAQKVSQLETIVKFEFGAIEDSSCIQSPEDKQERLHNKALNHMSQCKNLDDFYDILFYVEDTLIKANSVVLSARSPYFQSMLSTKYKFSESQVEKGGFIKVTGVSKLYFSCIIQYIYSDHFYIQKQEPEFFIKLLIFADYFMLPRLVDICSSYLKQFVNAKSALQLYLLAHSYNASQLEKYCLNFIALNELETLDGRYYRSFKRQCHESLLRTFEASLSKEREESFIQICLYKNSQTNNGSPFGQNNQQMLRKFNEEIDIDELLNTPYHIYLEEHKSLDSYDSFNNALISQLNQQQQAQNGRISIQSQQPFKGSKNGNHNLFQEECKTDKMTMKSGLMLQNENLHPNKMPSHSQNVSKTKTLSLLDRIGKFNNDTSSQNTQPLQNQQHFGPQSKQRENASRQPLRNLNKHDGDEDYFDHEDGVNGNESSEFEDQGDPWQNENQNQMQIIQTQQQSSSNTLNQGNFRF